MAEQNQNQPDAGAGNAEGKSSKSSMKFIIIGIVVVILAAGGYIGWTKFIKQPAEAKETVGKTASVQQSEQSGDSIGQVFDLETFLVNLADRGGKRYLKTKISLELSSELAVEEATARMPQLRDGILLLLSSKSMEEIQGIEGKIALRSELVMRVNQILKQGKVRNLYFTEFVIQ